MKISMFKDADAARRHYLVAADALAGRVRARHITDVPGQAMTYEFKRQDAEAFREAGEPDDADAHPWVAAEADAMDATLSEAADKILENRDLWWEAGLAIERERMRAKHAVRSAGTARAMHLAVEAARAEMEQISAAIADQQQQPQ